MRVFRIWHIGAWNRNVGDWALAYQTHRLLNEQANKRDWTLSFYLVDSQRTFFHPALIDQMNDEADLVLLGGGGLIFFRPEDESVSGWSFNISIHELSRIRVPIVVYAIGYNKFEFDRRHFPDSTGPHLRALQQRATLFSVRNHGTRSVLLKQYGLERHKLDVIPDPGIYLFDRPIEIPALDPGRPVVALNWAGDRPNLRYAKPHKQNAQHFMATVKSALLRLAREANAQIMFLPHLVHVDSDMYEEFANDFPPGSIFSTHVELPFLYPPPGEMLYPHIPFFTNIFRQADIVMGMRFHTCVLSFGAGTPFLRLGSHPKLAYFVNDTGVPDYAIPLVDPEVEDEDLMFRQIHSCLCDDAYQADIEKLLAQQIAILREFNENALNILDGTRHG